MCKEKARKKEEASSKSPREGKDSPSPLEEGWGEIAAC